MHSPFSFLPFIFANQDIDGATLFEKSDKKLTTFFVEFCSENYLE
jgi:hypothetical protein